MTRAIRKMMAAGLVSRDQFEQAMMLKARSGDTLSFHLVQIGALTDEEVVAFMLQHFEVRYYSANQLKNVSMEVLSLLPRDLAMKLRLLPIELKESTLVVGVTDPTRAHALEEAAYHTGREIDAVVITESDMSHALEKYYGKTVRRDTLPVRQPDEDSKTEVPNLHLLTPSDLPSDAQRTDPFNGAISVRPSVNVGVETKPASTSIWEEKKKGKKPGEEHTLTEGEILLAINRAEDRNTVIDCCLRYLLQFADRTAFFVVRKGAIRGYEIMGAHTSQSAIRSYWVPLIAESTLRQVVRERRIHLGPPGRTAADAILCASLGGRPNRMLAIPVEIGRRVVGLMYADRLHVKMPPWNRLERLAEVTGDNLRRIILKKSG